MKIRTHLFVLRPFKDSDAKSIAEAANNKKVFDNVRDYFPHPYSLTDAKQWIESCKRMPEPQTVFAIDVEGKAIGNISIFIKDDIYCSNVEIGYFLDEKYWNLGIITEAIGVITAYAFMNFDINRVYAEPFETNIASCRALQRVGFRREAVFEKNIIKNGVLQNSCIYAILREEYMTDERFIIL